MGADEELVGRTLEGDWHAYDQLMRRHERSVVRLASRFARSSEDALDIGQNTFVAAFRRLESFEGRSSFRSWLLRVAFNEGLNWVRAHRRHWAADEALELAELLPASTAAPDEELERGESLRSLLAGMARLHGRHRRALELRYFQELSVREVASELGCSEGAAKNLLFRAVRRLGMALSTTKMNEVATGASDE